MLENFHKRKIWAIDTETSSPYPPVVPASMPALMLQLPQPKTALSASNVLGSRLRELRKGMKLTLQEVARRCSVSTSNLSKIENGQISPSYDTLKKVCDGLAIGLERLVNPEQRLAFASGRRAVTRRGDLAIFKSEPYEYRVHASELSSKSMMPLEIIVRARDPRQFDHWSEHTGEEFVFVLEGAIRIHTETYAPLLLKMGESAYFDSGMKHVYVSVGRQDARVLSVSTNSR